MPLFFLLAVTIPAFARGDNDRVSVGSDITVAEGETAGDIVCVFCSVRVHGDVMGDVAVFLGSVTVDAGRSIRAMPRLGGDLNLGEGASVGRRCRGCGRRCESCVGSDDSRLADDPSGTVLAAAAVRSLARFPSESSG